MLQTQTLMCRLPAHPETDRVTPIESFEIAIALDQGTPIMQDIISACQVEDMIFLITRLVGKFKFAWPIAESVLFERRLPIAKEYKVERRSIIQVKEHKVWDDLNECSVWEELSNTTWIFKTIKGYTDYEIYNAFKALTGFCDLRAGVGYPDDDEF
jgi:hypothetical protein